MIRRALLLSSRCDRRPSQLTTNEKLPPTSFFLRPIERTSVECPGTDRALPASAARSFAGFAALFDEKSPPTDAGAKQKGGGGDKGKGGGDESVSVLYFWDNGTVPHDFPCEADDPSVIRFEEPFSMDDVGRHFAKEYNFAPDATYEYWKVGRGRPRWRELTDATQLVEARGKKAKSRNKPIWIRMDDDRDVEEYEGEVYDEDEDYDEDRAYERKHGEGKDAEDRIIFGVKGTIRVLVNKLKYANISVLPTEGEGVPTLRKGDGTIMRTRDYVLREAKRDRPLQDVLLRQVGGLDHIVQCLHLEFVWEQDNGDSEIPDAKYNG
ncbi:hypothetical protein ACHAWF_010463 [Thalassiosira exigua]